MYFINFLQNTTYDCCAIFVHMTNVFVVLAFCADIKYIQIFRKILPKVSAILFGKRNEQAGTRVKLKFFIK